jgi:hypothetical protein
MAEKVWNTPDPTKKDKPLSSGQKSAAKARAKAAGRPYPNLVDNMAAAKMNALSRMKKKSK